MRIPCPFCGERDVTEFVCRGEAGAQRPAAGAGTDAFGDYVYDRRNAFGPTTEYWYHAYGCRRWLTVSRDTRTHAVTGAVLAREQGR